MPDEEKELSLEERRRRLEERRNELEKRRTELRRLAEEREAGEEEVAAPPPVPPEAVEPEPVAPRVAEVPPAPEAVEEVEVAPSMRPPIPPGPPPARKGKGALVAAVVVIGIVVVGGGYMLLRSVLRPSGPREPSEEELLAEQARQDSLLRVQLQEVLRDAGDAIAAAEADGAAQYASELLALAVSTRDSAVEMQSVGDLRTATDVADRSVQTAREAGQQAAEARGEREREQERREAELRGVASMVAAARESVAAVDAVGGRRYAAGAMVQLDTLVRAAGAMVDAGDAAAGRRELRGLGRLLSGAREEIVTAKAEEEEVRRRLEEEARRSEEEERTRREEEERRAAMQSTPPQMVQLAAPEYPPLARAAGVQGTVTLDFLVDADGTVRDIQVVEGPAALGDAARDALLRSTITAATQGGQAVPARMQQKFTFRL
jgi:TonB family protein